MFSGTILLAQVGPPPNAPVRDPFPMTPVTVASATSNAPPLNQQAASPQARQLASQKLHSARKAVATKDIATAERLLNEVLAMQLTYQDIEDQPILVQNLIRDYRHIAELRRTQGDTEQNRLYYARFNLIQADTMLRRGELDLAMQLTQEAEKQRVQYNQEDRSRELEPVAMLRRIEDARRIRSANTPSYAAVQGSQQPLSQASEEQLARAIQLLQQAQTDLDAGQFERAEQLARGANAFELPDYAFQQNNSPSPNRLLTEIAARRQGVATAQTPTADAQSALYRPMQDHTQTMQTAAGGQTLAPPIPVPYIDQNLQNRHILQSQIASDVIQRLSDAQRMCEEQRKPDAALDMLYELRRKLEQTMQLDSPTKQSYIAQVDRAIERTRGFGEQYAAQERQNQTNEAVLSELKYRADTFRNKEEVLNAMFKEHNKFAEEHRYYEALLVAKKAKEFAPEDPQVHVLLTMSQLVYNTSRSEEIRDLKRDGVLNELMAVDERTAIPNFDGGSMIYSGIWDQITGRRQVTNRGMQQNQRLERERQIIHQLDQPVTLSIDRAIPLEQALRLLCSQVDIEPYLDRTAFKEADITTEMMVVMPPANGIKAKSVLKTILDQLGLAYVVKNEMLQITSTQRAKGSTYLKMYYVGDIIDFNHKIEGANLMQKNIEDSFRAQSPPGYGKPNEMQYMPMGVSVPGAPGQGILGPDGMPLTRNGIPNPAVSDPNVFAQMYGGMNSGYGGMNSGYGGMMGGMNGMMGGGMMSSIDQTIQTVIEPESWEMANMGGEGVLSVYPATQSLAIRQTEEVHAQIEDLLTQIRKMHDLQVAVEVRYITLSDQFYERMGTAFDMAFRNDGAFNHITQINNTFPGTDGTDTTTTSTRGNNVTVGLSAPGVFNVDASIPITQDSFGVAIPAFGGYNPTAGISTGFALLSNIETYFFIQAAQGDRRNTVMEAPKVMLHNGQPGMINDTTQIPFVTSVTPVVADFAIGYQPIVTTFNQGQVLNVQATVSNDRQHVRLQLNPIFTSLVRVQTFKYFGEDVDSEETETSRDETATTSTDPRNARKTSTSARSGITIQQPIWATFSVSTTVSCPDGGTVMLGGIKRVSEGRTEAGVPILNKLPYIQRLFSNTAIGRDTQSVMIMVTPRIIIQEEEELHIMGGNMP